MNISIRKSVLLVLIIALFQSCAIGEAPEEKSLWDMLNEPIFQNITNVNVYTSSKGNMTISLDDSFGFYSINEDWGVIPENISNERFEINGASFAISDFLEILISSIMTEPNDGYLGMAFDIDGKDMYSCNILVYNKDESNTSEAIDFYFDNIDNRQTIGTDSGYLESYNGFGCLIILRNNLHYVSSDGEYLYVLSGCYFDLETFNIDPYSDEDVLNGLMVFLHNIIDHIAIA